MVSLVDPTVPVFGNPTTLSVRQNFARIKFEIEQLQAQVGIGAPVPVNMGGTGASTPAQAAINLNVLPLTGGTLTGPLTLVGPPQNINNAATKGYVDAYFPVSIVNGGTGANNSTQALINLGGSPLNSPNFTGNPTAPTPPSSDNSQSLATTAFVYAALGTYLPISIMRGGTGATTAPQALLNLGAAPLNSPFFTGVPLAPNPNLGSNNQQIATTQFVMASLDAFPGGASVTVSGTAPTSPRVGDLWFNTSTNALSMWDGTNWVGVGGSTGPQGPAGPPGSGLAIAGTVPTESDLPTSGVPTGAVYVATDTGIGYFWNGSTWTSLGAVLQGPTGPQGPPGTGGGAATVISDTAPSPPTVGQLWWDSVGGQLYIYYQDATTSQWVIANNQPGPAGPTGPTGPAGPQGNPGTPWPEAPTDGRVYGRDGATAQWLVVPPEAPNDGQGYLRIGVSPGTWEPGLPISGGTLTGPLTLDANATTALQAVTLQQLTSATAGYLPLVGGTLSGPGNLTMANLTVNNVAVQNQLGGPVAGGPLNISTAATIGADLTVSTGNFTLTNGTGVCTNIGGGWIFGSGAGLYGQSAGWNMRTAGTGGYIFGVQQATDPALAFALGGTSLMLVYSTGNMTIAGSLTQGSDETTKTNINPISQGVSLVNQLIPKSFQRIAPAGAAEQPLQWGFIAQDVQPIISEAVTSVPSMEAGGTATLSLDTTAILAAVVLACKQLLARVMALETAANITPPAAETA